MKKIIAFLVGTSLSLTSVCVAASSEKQFKALDFDYSQRAVDISDVVCGEAGEMVSVTVANQSKGDSFSVTNTPDIFDAYYLNSDGKIGKDIVFSKNLMSGRYNIFINGSSGQQNFYTIYRNEDDEATKNLISQINSAANSAEIKAIVYADSNREILGIDREDESVGKYLEGFCDISYDVRKALGSVFTSSLFYQSFNQYIACCMLSEGDTDIVFADYAEFFGTTYEAYCEKSGDVRETISSYLAEVEFLTYDGNSVFMTDLEKMYEDICLLADIIQTKSWSELKQIITDNIHVLEADTSDYDDIKDSLRYKVFTEMFDEKEDYDSLSDVKKSFEDISDKVKDSQKTNEKGSSSSSGSSSSGKGSLPAISAEPGFASGNSSVSTTGSSFKDCIGHYGESYIRSLADRGVIKGYGDGRFLPDTGVTRAEFAKMISVLFSIVADGEKNSFDDVDDNAWYGTYVQDLSKVGIINGYEGKFRPDENITRQDAAVICHRVLEYLDADMPGDAQFADFDQVDDYAKSAVSALASQGIVNGYNNMFAPDNNITRADTAIMLCRLYELYSESAK